jgi:hypothetical protein
MTHGIAVPKDVFWKNADYRSAIIPSEWMIAPASAHTNPYSSSSFSLVSFRLRATVPAPQPRNVSYGVIRGAAIRILLAEEMSRSGN